MLLSDFREDRTYSVWGGTSNPSAGIASHVGFILADLRSLAPDQVWAAPERTPSLGRPPPEPLDLYLPSTSLRRLASTPPERSPGQCTLR